MVVNRPHGLSIVKVAIEFNSICFSKLEIDLEHINKGSKSTRETDFSSDQISLMVKFFLDGEFLEAEAQQAYGDEACDYFSLIKNFADQRYKLVFCICTDQVDTLGIISFYRVKG